MKYIIIGLLLIGSCKVNLTVSNNCADINTQLYKEIPNSPVGGGIGYENRVIIDNSFMTVNTLQELINAINNPSINKIHINSTSPIEVFQQININRDDLVIAGNRGATDSNGKLIDGAEIILQHDNSSSKSIFQITSNNVRITGLRLKSEIISDNYSGIKLEGANVSRELNLIVDNCEISNFGYAGVQINGHSNSQTEKIKCRINHNYIHHNNKQGLGYGVVINYKNSEAEIYYNWFDQNRHSVAGNGRSGEVYTAAYNFTLSNSMNSAEYDMHGFSDFNKNNCSELQNCTYNSSCNIAGKTIILLNNACVNSRYFFGLRGIPQEGAYALNNFSSSPSFFKLWRTWSNSSNCSLLPPNDENINLEPVEWEAYKFYQCENYNLPDTRCYYNVSWSGRNNWVPLFFNLFNKNQASINDFNGDNIDDLFVSNGTSWKLSSKTSVPLSIINTSSYTNQSLRFGDFDGNGSADVFLADGNNWRVSWNGTSNWEIINNSSYDAQSLRFGDFNGDKITDVLRFVEF